MKMTLHGHPQGPGMKAAQKHMNGADPIHINPANKGKFTAYAKSKGQSVQQAAHAVVASPSASPTLKKRAQFAINATKFKH